MPADEEFDWAARYQPALRALPLAAGGAGLVGVLLNRVVSGVGIPAEFLPSVQSEHQQQRQHVARHQSGVATDSIRRR